MSYTIAKMHSMHKNIIRLHVLGASHQQISDETGFSMTAISGIINSDLGKTAVEQMHQQIDKKVVSVGEQIAEAAKEGQKFLSAIAAGTIEAPMGLRAKVAMDQLDRHGYGKITRTVNLDLQGDLSLEDIQEIKARAKKMLNVVDVVAEESSGTDSDN